MSRNNIFSLTWLTRRAEFRVYPRPLSGDFDPIDLVSTEMGGIAPGPRLYGTITRDVPLLILPNVKQEYDFGEPLDVDSIKLVNSLGLLATTQTGFMPTVAPDFRFPGILNIVSIMCSVGSSIYAREDEDAFRKWMREQIDSVVASAANWDEIVRQATSLPLPRQEMLMVPLVYLNHMWRQGNPALSAASGPSAMPQAFNALLDALAKSTGILPRFNQLMMTMRAWKIDGIPEATPVSYRDLTDLTRVRPYFWLNGASETELEFYRAFWTVESLGIPVYGWGCLALESASANDAELGAFALRCILGTLRNIYFATRYFVPHVEPIGFRKIQLTGGWVNDDLNGAASGYQLPFMIMLDSLFKVNYSNQAASKSRANGLRFVPRRWLRFFKALSERSPGLRSWVLERNDPELTDTYQRCIELFVIHRTMHRHLAGQTLRGSTTTARTFCSAESNYRDFMCEMKAIIDDTISVGVSTSVFDRKSRSMKKKNRMIVIQVETKRVIAPKMSILQEVCDEHQLPIRFGCRSGCCGSCLVKVISGNANLSRPTDREARTLDVLEAEPSWRLACQCVVAGDVHVQNI